MLLSLFYWKWFNQIGFRGEEQCEGGTSQSIHGRPESAKKIRKRRGRRKKSGNGEGEEDCEEEEEGGGKVRRVQYCVVKLQLYCQYHSVKNAHGIRINTHLCFW